MQNVEEAHFKCQHSLHLAVPAWQLGIGGFSEMRSIHSGGPYETV